MISLLASGLSLFHSITLLFSVWCSGFKSCDSCCEASRKRTKNWIAKLNNISSTSYSAGISTSVTDAMFAFTADDLADAKYGKNLYLLIAGIAVSVVGGFASYLVKSREEEKLNDKEESDRRRQNMEFRATSRA
ncbi:uncharacterized protein LOC113474196 [Ciona intestinalis]